MTCLPSLWVSFNSAFSVILLWRSREGSTSAARPGKEKCWQPLSLLSIWLCWCCHMTHRLSTGQRGSRIPLPVHVEGSSFLLCLLGICSVVAPSPWGCIAFSWFFSVFCQWEQLKHRNVVALALNCIQAPIPHEAVSGSPSFCKTNRWLRRRPRHWGKEWSAEVAAGGKRMFYTCQAGALDKADLIFILAF